MSIIFSPFLISLFISVLIIDFSHSRLWPGHDTSTLKLLQLIHRHGERAPLSFFDIDPYRYASYWPQGVGQLTQYGKKHIYSIGKEIGSNYASFLGDRHSPREISVQSSSYHRCIESVSSLLAGMYPPGSNWTWDDPSNKLSQLWQPIAIETYLPAVNDTLLVAEKPCPNVEAKTDEELESEKVVKFMEENQHVLDEINEKVGKNILGSLGDAAGFHNTLMIEMNNGYYWDHIWNKSQQDAVLVQLEKFDNMEFTIGYDLPLFQRIRSGRLVERLRDNIKVKLDELDKKETQRSSLRTSSVEDMNEVPLNPETEKMYVFSTHDTIVAVISHAFGIFNGIVPPLGATILLELHQGLINDKNETFVRVYYLNETTDDATSKKSSPPYLMEMPSCYEEKFKGCSLEKFIEATQHLLYEDFDTLCGLKINQFWPEIYLLVGIGVGVILMFIGIFIFKRFNHRKINKKI